MKMEMGLGRFALLIDFFDDEDADGAGQVAAALAVNFGDQLRNRLPTASGDGPQPIPKDIFNRYAGPVSGNRDGSLAHVVSGF